VRLVPYRAPPKARDETGFHGSRRFDLGIGQRHYGGPAVDDPPGSYIVTIDLDSGRITHGD